MPGWTIRPMRPSDVAEAAALSETSFHARDVAAGRATPAHRTPDRTAAWTARTHHLLASDPGGCWVADRGHTMTGFATSWRRELMWGLATYAVAPDQQGRGIGRALLEAALAHSRGCLRGMICSSDDPRAARRYRLAGFDLHPQLTLTGPVDRTAVPDGVWDRIREGGPGDRDRLDSLDRRTRGAAHGPDHEVLTATHRLLVSDATTGEGYVYLDPVGGPVLLAASNRRTAQRLLWAALADGPDETRVRHLTAANQWALDVGLAAGLRVGTEGFLCVRGMRPPTPYLHHGSLL